MALQKIKNSQGLLLLLAAGLLSSCAHVPRVRHVGDQEKIVSTPPASSEASPSESSGVIAPPEGLPSSPESLAQGENNRKVKFGVWIDSQGVDAFAALGFLQTLDKRGFRPAKVVGAGMGCWIALSWSYANNSNQAEWQSFKWNDWRTLKTSFLNRITRSSQVQFEQQVEKLRPAKSWGDLPVPVDCPVISESTPFLMMSSRDLKPETAFWISMQLEAFGVSEDRLVSGGFYSGFLGGAPSSDELFRFSHELKSNVDERFGGWIVLSSRESFLEDSNVENPVRVLLSGRDLNWPKELVIDDDEQGVAKILKVTLLSGKKLQKSELSMPENRRRYLVQGRKLAEQLLQQDELNSFFR